MDGPPVCRQRQCLAVSDRQPSLKLGAFRTGAGMGLSADGCCSQRRRGRVPASLSGSCRGWHLCRDSLFPTHYRDLSCKLSHAYCGHKLACPAFIHLDELSSIRLDAATSLDIALGLDYRMQLVQSRGPH